MLTFSQTPGRPPLLRLFVVSGCVHVSQGQFARIDPAPLARIHKIQAKLLDGVINFSRSPRQRGSKGRAAFTAVHRGQRLDSSLGSRNDGFAARAHRARNQPVEPLRRKIWQVAGNDQIPARMCCGQSRRNSCKRSIARRIRSALSPSVAVCDYVQSERRISAGRSHNRDLRDQRLEQSSGVKDQRDAVEIEKSLVAAHSRTGTPRKNETSDLGMALHVCPAILRPRAELAQRSGGL